ncbi:DUF1330 domain-containing protein [Terrihabitans rhizophilus]|uniref:DUF1330 domain-containing protein n=1 Tax=Terrihabitans rhizophilus TaxID=3092662 RepID=A0ABU4RJN5_9HYPH|nr:DUF1330 domain-containing protein [Terrihabitans sp. PJ23]MDX6805040.1 DUF1330 domain-containing protein [Terrihabitans sp. PJ23]
MAKGYWIARLDVSDAEAFKDYAARSPGAIEAFGGRYLTRGGRFEAVQGTARARNVIVEFPSFQAALDCWNSPQYQEAKGFRDGHCEAEFIVIEGTGA